MKLDGRKDIHEYFNQIRGILTILSALYNLASSAYAPWPQDANLLWRADWLFPSRHCP